MSSKYTNYILNKIASAKKQADSLCVGIGHHGIEGSIRELALKECVEPFLTQSYQASCGKVIDSLQNITDQLDLIVYHKKVVPPILISKDLGLFPVECVRYVFEVKSRLTATEIKDANKKFNSVKQLVSFPKKQSDNTIIGGILPNTVLFAFGSDIQSSEIERYKKYYTGDYPPCTVLCVLGKGYWFYNSAQKKWYGRETNVEFPENYEFCMFIIGIMNSLSAEETSMKPFLPGGYVGEDLMLPPA